MKILLEVIGLFSISWILTVSGLRCWTCENAKSQKDCLEKGQSKQCNFLDKVCQTEIRYSAGWGRAPMIRTGCKQPHACGNNNIQNPRPAWFPTQCNAGRFNSVCRCCCAGNHCNRQNLLCQTVHKQEVTPSTAFSPPTQPPRDEAKSTNFSAPTPEPPCKRFPSAPTNGEVTCDGKDIGSSCSFTCNDGYKLVGSKETTCSHVGKTSGWNLSAPTCVYESEFTEKNIYTSRKYTTCSFYWLVKCTNLPDELVNGRMECHGNNEVGSECSFICDEGYILQGTARIECKGKAEIPLWSDTFPACLTSEPHCPPLGELSHGNVTCTRGDNGLGTKCLFQCSEESYELLPRGRYETECVEKQGKAYWTKRKPCCSVECPPVAKKDIVIAIDSSRSISLSEWNIMKKFITDVIRRFDVTSEAVQFAVYRFNGKVDTKSQILFGDYDNAEELIYAVKSIPKEGSGTRIGKALEHARDYVLRHKNREEIDDMIWVLTDGKSKDDFTDVAENLRRDGVEIIALGISRTGEKEFIEHLEEMTGSEELVLEVGDVKNSFSEALVQRVTGKICEISCD